MSSLNRGEFQRVLREVFIPLCLRAKKSRGLPRVRIPCPQSAKACRPPLARRQMQMGRSVHMLAAIDREGSSSDKITVVGSEKYDPTSNISGSTEPPHGYTRNDLL